MPPSPATIDTEFPGLASALAGSYRIERELGRGGMGVVFLARDHRLDRPVALKILPPALAADPVVRERFLREARTAAQLSHPNIVPVYSADEAGGWAYFAMAYVDGESLGERIRSLGALPPTEVARLLRDAAWALAYAHARGVVHRDVKPDNLLIERGTSRLVVTDFGIAYAPDASPLTQTGLVMGSVHFMSPEQGAGDALDGRSDLYSLGTVGFLALSGRLPFQHDQASAILVQRATRDAPSLRAVATDVPPSIAEIIDQCLARDPDARPATGEALAERLDRAREDVVTQEAASRPHPPLSETDANLVWRRAAQLQAEAAARLEARTREVKALQNPAAASSNDGERERDASGAYRVEQVQSAAEEAGISRQYVALALAELNAGRGEGKGLEKRAAEASPAVRAVLGKHPRTISVSRTFDHAPREVLAAMGHALQRPPAALRLRETLGGHALHGGVLLFDLPVVSTDGSGTYSAYMWTWSRYQLWVKTLRVQLAAEPGNSSRTIVTMSFELPEGYYASLWESAAFGAGGTGIGGFISLILVKKALILTIMGFPATLPLLAGGAAVGALGNRLLYQHAVRKAKDELSSALNEIALEFIRDHVFGDPFGDPSTPRRISSR